MNLKSDDIELRNFNKEDAKKMAVLADNYKISRNLRDGFPNPYTIENAEDFIRKFIFQNPLTVFAIEYKNEYVGNIGLSMGVDVYRKSAELGYFIGEPYWNLGITTTAINLITEYGFQKLNLIRIYSGVFDFNLASQRVLEKCNFTREGIMKKAVFKSNKICDEYRYAKINPKYDNQV